MEVRKMTIEDYDTAFEMWAHTSQAGIRSMDDSREGIAGFLRRNPENSFVAISEDKVVGVILCGHDGRRGHIYHTSVRDPNRWRTIGRALLEAVYDSMKKEGIRKIGLLVDSDNDAGNFFWEMQGWVRRKDLNYYNIGIIE